MVGTYEQYDVNVIQCSYEEYSVNATDEEFSITIVLFLT